MDVDPKTTSEKDAGSSRGENRTPLPATESSVEGVLKGRYLLGPVVGRGGFGITYLAADLDLASRKVVVKVLNERRSGDAWSLKRFRSEMEALARIDHPNVVGVTDFGQGPDGKPFIVMQYIAGCSLREILPREGLPLAQVAHIMRQACRAVSAAHEAGVWHRDLKPENIMIQGAEGGEEQVKVIDFGLASVREAGEGSQSNSTAGTHAYMAPEQFEGRSSTASDIYQLGVVAYELVTGIVPFRASSPGGIALQQMEGLKVPPKSLRPELPRLAQEAIVKALSPDPRERYGRAREFGEALASALVSGDLAPAGWMKGRSNSGGVAGVARTQRLRRLLIPLLVSAALALAVGATAYFFLAGGARGSESVAVLPFENRTGDPDMAYLAEGVSESLINDLSRIPTLRVSARAAVHKYEGQRVDPRVAGAELGVTRVIDGSISRRGGDLFMDTELVDVQSGTRLWGSAYQRKISSLTEMLQQFSTEVTDQLRLKLSGPLKDRLKRQYAVGSEPYQQYLKGRFHLNKRTGRDFQEAIGYFNQAIAANPEYAPAYSGLADTYGFIAAFGAASGGMIPAQALEQSRIAAKRALELDGTLAEAYAAIAFVEMQADYNWGTAEQDFRRAIDLDYGWPNAHELYAFELGATGRFEEAMREAELAEKLAPDVLGMKLAHGLVLHMAGRHDESLAILRAAPTTSLATPADYIAEDYWAKSMPKEALAAVESISARLTIHMRVPLLAAAYGRAGQAEKARQLLNSYAVQQDTAWWYYLALARLGLHETEGAIDALERAYQQRDEEVIWFNVDPMLHELRTNTRFRALLERVKPK